MQKEGDVQEKLATEASNGCVCDSAASLQEPLTDTWLIRLKYSWDEWACEPMSRRHDEALMAGTVGSFSSFPLILPSFHFFHVSLLIKSLQGWMIVPGGF